MRTSSMSNGTLLASRAPPPPPSQQQQLLNSGAAPGNPAGQAALLGQLPAGANPSLMKAASAVGQNVAAVNKMFQTNAAMSAVGNVGILGNNNNANHRNTPPMPPTFPYSAQQPPQRIGFPQAPPPDASAIINESEFPSLNMRASPHHQQQQHPVGSAGNNMFTQAQFNNLHAMSMYSKEAFSALQNRMPYANLMRGGGLVANDAGGAYGQTNEFSLQSEDFPALPGASPQQQQHLLQQQNNLGAIGSSASNQTTNSMESQQFSSSSSGAHTNFGAQSNFYNATAVTGAAGSTDFTSNGTNENGRDPKLSISVNAANGIVSNIPPGMLCDQYGIAGLLAFMKAIDQYPALSAMSVGLDVTKLGLNMTSTTPLYQTFGGPWSEQSCRLQEAEAKVPEEYLTTSVIRDRLPVIKVTKLSEDILFYLFYNCPGQVYQLAAACELYHRDWRYHKSDGVWLTRSVYGGMKEQTIDYEKGSYNIFDPVQWRKIPKEMTLEYKMLEPRPTANPLINAQNFVNNSNGNVTTPGQVTTPFAQQPPNMAHFSSKNL